MLNMGTIYKITNTVNGKAYIGQSTRDAIGERIPAHLRGHGNIILRHAVDKYGKDVFSVEILHDGIINELLDCYELDAIKQHNTLSPNGYNLILGGNSNKVYSKETRSKMSEAMRGNTNGRGNTHSPETRRKISESNKGRKLTEEQKQHLSNINTGKTYPPRSEESRLKMSKAMKGNTNGRFGKGIKRGPLPTEACRKKSETMKIWWSSEENRRKMSEAKKGRERPPLSEEHRRKISEGLKRFHESKT